MINKKVFFDEYRRNLDPDKKLDQKEVSAIDDFLGFVEGSSCLLDLNQWAYVFATTFHETNATFLPIEEANWLSWNARKKYFSEMYDPILGKTANRRKMAIDNGNTQRFDGEKYFGRGFVQLTWKNNYSKYGKVLGEDLVKYPDLAAVPKYAFKIMIHGFITGGFTGRKISDYINSKNTDYKGARRCINGTDKAELIKVIAIKFENILKKSFIR